MLAGVSDRDPTRSSSRWRAMQGHQGFASKPEPTSPSSAGSDEPQATLLSKLSGISIPNVSITLPGAIGNFFPDHHIFAADVHRFAVLARHFERQSSRLEGKRVALLNFSCG